MAARPINTSVEKTTPVLIEGFLLTRQWRDAADGVVFDFWISTDDGPFQVLCSGQESVFFVRGLDVESTLSYLKSHNHSQFLNCQWRYQLLKLVDFKQNPMFGFYFKSHRMARRVRDDLVGLGVHPLEADIRPDERFLMERFITGSMKFYHVGAEKFHHGSKMSSSSYEPKFKAASLDIETSFYTNELYSIAVLTDDEEKVFVVGEGEGGDEEGGISNSYIEYFSSEKKVLERFIQWVAKTDPDVFIGWNVINFDFHFLAKKAKALGVPLSLGRGNRKVEWRTAQANADHHFITIPGRAVLDGIDTLKSATYNFESFSLEFVSRQLLDRGKLIHNVDDRAKEIQQLFENDKPALAKYNLEDCQLVWDIFEKTDLYGFAIQRAQMTGLAIDRMGGSVASFDNLYLPRLHREGYVAPNLGTNEPKHSPGGYVMDSMPGLYQHVLVLDFKSLYPSIIRTFKIDPMGLIEGMKDIESDGDEIAEPDLTMNVPGFNGAIFSKRKNLLPTIIENLWRQRDVAKANNNASMSQVIKIIMNSFYGVLGSPGCRFFDSRLSSSITLRGHEILTRSKELIEENGYTVIYGDTDSVFVWVGNEVSNRDAEKVGRVLSTKLNQWWGDHLTEQYGIECALEIEFETHYSKFVMPTIRGSERGSKKRYAGIVLEVVNGEEVQTLKFKGLETVRTDWTQLARDVQHELYRRVFAEEPYIQYLVELVEGIRAGKYDHMLVYRKRLRQGVDDYKKNVPPQARAARLVDDERAARSLPSRYHRGGWIEYVMTLSGPEPKEYLRSPLDYEHYLERQIEPVVDGILHFNGESFATITSDQMGLFADF